MAAHHNCSIISQRLLTLVNINYSKLSIREKLEYHSDYPSIVSIKDTFTAFNIESMVVSLQPQQLHEIPLPAVLHTYDHKKQGEFVLLSEVAEADLTIIRDNGMKQNLNIEGLTNIWKGVALLLETNTNSGDPDFARYSNRELVHKISIFIAVLFASIGLFIVLNKLPSILYPLFAIKTSGLTLSILMLRKQLGIATDSLTEKFCSHRSNYNCDEFINNDKYKLFNEYSLSELALLYFGSGLFMFLLQVFNTTNVEGSWFVPSVLAILPTFYTLYEQFRVKKWCSLCLSLTLLIWVEFGYSLAIHSYTPLFIYFEPILVSVSIIILLWLSVRKSIINSADLPLLKRKSNRFAKDAGVFKAVLQDSISISYSQQPFDIWEGNDKAKNELILISNPTCKYCSDAHSLVQKIIAKNSNIKVTYRFAHLNKNTASIDTAMVSTLLGLNTQRGREEALKAMHNWFNSYGNKDYNVWKMKYDVDEDVSTYLSWHTEWTSQAQLNRTPCFVFNGKLVPDIYDDEDLEYLLKIQN